MEKLLTIAIPTYNGVQTIENLLRIMLPQCDDRVEVLISDNASTDGTEGVVSRFINIYSFIKYIRNIQNIGPDSNFLQCFKEAKGKYILLISDDDILIEGSLKTILDFLESDDISLLYLNTIGFREFYKNVDYCIRYDYGTIYDDKVFITKDKKIFMNYAFRLWGYLSCFIVSNEAFKSLDNVERFKGSNWLQTYIFTQCANYGKQLLGVISKPCIAAGIYSNVYNYDSGRVHGDSFKDLCEFAIKQGFDEKQMKHNYLWHVCYLSKRAIIKERALGINKTSVKALVKSTLPYPYAWIHLYPYILLPSFLCKFIVYINNKIKGYNQKSVLNRVGDTIG